MLNFSKSGKVFLNAGVFCTSLLELTPISFSAKRLVSFKKFSATERNITKACSRVYQMLKNTSG